MSHNFASRQKKRDKVDYLDSIFFYWKQPLTSIHFFTSLHIREKYISQKEKITWS
jgi:hypothetical protein